MADGWRSLWMAPVYALGIAFVLAFGLGFAFRTTTPPPPPTTGPTPTPSPMPTTQPVPTTGPEPTLLIRFQVAGGSAEQEATPLDGVAVQVTGAGGEQERTELDGSGAAGTSVPTPSTLCAALSEGDGWFLVSPRPGTEGDRMCVPVPDGAAEITVVVSRRVG